MICSFKALVGSHNYNLNTKDSDKDYKEFFYPSFDDLYSGEKYSKSVTGEMEDVEYHDIRKLPDMLWKSNVNFLEVLFSIEVKQYDLLYKELHNKREKIARMNLPYLYDACMGMFYKKKKEYERDLQKEVEWKKICKHVMSTVRIVDVLNRYCSNNWNFEDAIRYTEDEFMYRTLMDIRNCRYDDQLQLNIFIDGAEKLLGALKGTYKDMNEDLETKEWLYQTIKCEVEEQVFRELQ